MTFLAKVFNRSQDVRLRVHTGGIFKTNVPDGAPASTVDYTILNQVLDRLALKPDDCSSTSDAVPAGCSAWRPVGGCSE